MKDFIYYSPTEIHFGKGAELQAGKLLKKYGAKKVLVHYGGNSVKASGLLDRVLERLDKSKIAYVTLGGVVPNPRISLVREGIELCKQEGVDYILAVGGGSVIDSAKAIGFGLANPDIEIWDYFEGKVFLNKCTPIGVILTLSATGSELSNASVITNEDGWLKRSVHSDACRPAFALMNPEITYTVSKYQTASGAADIMMHTMERYFQQEELMDITYGIAESLLRDVMHYLPIALEQPDNYEARAELMWCSSLSHVDLTHLGGDRGDWSCHQMEHELGGMFDVAHGAGLAAVWGSWARYVLPYLPARFARFAVNVMGVEPKANDTETALAGIEAFEAFMKQVGMPTSLTELGVEATEEVAVELAKNCSGNGSREVGITGVHPLGYEDLKIIYTNAL